MLNETHLPQPQMSAPEFGIDIIVRRMSFTPLLLYERNERQCENAEDDRECEKPDTPRLQAVAGKGSSTARYPTKSCHGSHQQVVTPVLEEFERLCQRVLHLRSVSHDVSPFLSNNVPLQTRSLYGLNRQLLPPFDAIATAYLPSSSCPHVQSKTKGLLGNPMTGIAGCCARTASGDAAADPAIPAMKSRRRIGPGPAP